MINKRAACGSDKTYISNKILVNLSDDLSDIQVAIH